MDDFVFFTKSRHKLRWVIKEVYSILDKLKLKLAPDKTYIGNISGGKGLIFLGIILNAHALQYPKQVLQTWQ